MLREERQKAPGRTAACGSPHGASLMFLLYAPPLPKTTSVQITRDLHTSKSTSHFQDPSFLSYHAYHAWLLTEIFLMWNSHNIKLIILKIMAFNTHNVVQTHLCQVSRHFHHPKTKPSTQINAHPPLPTHLLFVFIYLPALHILYICHHALSPQFDAADHFLFL